MKKNLVILTALVVVLVCTCVAIVVSNERKTHVTVEHSLAVKSLQTQLKQTQDVQRLHDQTNTAALHNAGATIVALTNQKVVLCAQLKAAKLVQPLCQ